MTRTSLPYSEKSAVCGLMSMHGDLLAALGEQRYQAAAGKPGPADVIRIDIFVPPPRLVCRMREPSQVCRVPSTRSGIRLAQRRVTMCAATRSGMAHVDVRPSRRRGLAGMSLNGMDRLLSQLAFDG
jgi:hypothetical protein